MSDPSGPALRLAVVGHPVAHSRSPAMQSAALEALGLAEEWEYGAIDVEPADFRQEIRGLPDEGYRGVNVTVPHKRAAWEIADERGEEAERIGAANTLTFGPEGIRADNTDGPALVALLTGADATGPGLVLGAGGAARAAVWALRRLDLETAIWNRTPDRASALAVETGSEAVGSPDPADFGVVVNASAAGLDGADPFRDLPFGPDRFVPEQTVVELVYGSGPGALVEAASRAGARTIDGIDVLVRQGALSLAIWTGLDAPLDVMDRAARDA